MVNWKGFGERAEELTNLDYRTRRGGFDQGSVADCGDRGVACRMIEEEIRAKIS